MEDDGPYEPQCQLGISVCDVIIPNVHQLDLGLAKTNKRGEMNPHSINIVVYK